MLDWIEATRLARAVAASASITAWLSACHAVGFALLTGSALVANLRGLDAVLDRYAVTDVARPANRALVSGLAASTVTGLPLFAARATEAAANGFFVAKMLLLGAACAVQFAVARRFAGDTSAPSSRRLVSAVALSLWLGLALAALAFVLLE